MSTLDRVALELAGGARIVLQRVSRADPTSFAPDLAARLGRDVVVVADPHDSIGAVRVYDARSVAPGAFDGWDSEREALGASPLVVLLDATTGRQLLREAPQLASWAGGVAMPDDGAVRFARSDEEIRIGELTLRAALQAAPDVARRYAGQNVGVDIGTQRLYVPDALGLALARAREDLDEGIIYVGTVGEVPP